MGALAAAMVGGYVYCTGSGMLYLETSIQYLETLLQAASHQDGGSLSSWVAGKPNEAPQEEDKTPKKGDKTP